MAATQVSSSNIRAIDWADNQLTVEFSHGGTYVYEGVLRETFDLMLASESVGKFFHREVKNKFVHKKL